MRLQAEIRYAQPPAEVSTMTFDPRFQERKSAATGALRYTVDVTVAGGRTVVTTEREMPTSEFPDFLKSFVGGSLKVIQVDDWGPPAADGARTGTVTVTIPSAPVKLTGTIQLTAQGRGALCVVEAELKASVPLIGGKVEKAAAPAVMSAVRAEQATADEWFAQRRH